MLKYLRYIHAFEKKKLFFSLPFPLTLNINCAEYFLWYRTFYSENIKLDYMKKRFAKFERKNRCTDRKLKILGAIALKQAGKPDAGHFMYESFVYFLYFFFQFSVKIFKT